MGFKARRSIPEPTIEVQADQIEEVFDLSLYDASGVQQVARQFGDERDADEDERHRFADPSLVVRAARDGGREELAPPRSDDSGQLASEFFGEPVGAPSGSPRPTPAPVADRGLFDVPDAEPPRRGPSER